MKLKTILFITLFLGAVVLSQQATLDEQQEGILDRAREAERRAIGELKVQYENAKQQFKTTFKKVKTSNPPPEDTSDSDSVIEKAISAAENAADAVKAGEWKSVSGLKAQLQKAKEAYKNAVAGERRYIDELKGKAKNAKQQFKAAFNKARGVSNVDSSDSDAVIQEEIKTAETASDSNAANEWKGLSALKEQAQKAKDAYKSAKANLKSRTDSLTEEARAAEHKAVSELKAQAKNAKEQFKATFKKLKGTRASSSDSSDSDAAIQKGITEADTASDTTKSNEWKAVSELKAQAQKAKEAYRAAKADLKSRIKKTRESSDSSSDSSDSSDSDDAVDKVKHAAEWGVITTLKSQAKKAKQVAKQAYNKLKNLYRSEKESDSSSDSSDGVVKEAAEAAGEKAAETVTEKAVEEAQSLLEQARNAQITAYLELKEGAKRAKDTFKNAYRDLKAKIRGEKTAEPAKPQVETDL